LQALEGLIGEATEYHILSMGLELTGVQAITEWLVGMRRDLDLREVPKEIVQVGHVVVAFTRCTMVPPGGVATEVDIVDVFRFEGDVIAECWGLAV
jgi:hypothetical protein